MAPYHPIFMDGWSPEYPIPVSDDHLTNVPATGVHESKKSREEIKNPNLEVNMKQIKLLQINIDFFIRIHNVYINIYIFFLTCFRENYEILYIIIGTENILV